MMSNRPTTAGARAFRAFTLVALLTLVAACDEQTSTERDDGTEDTATDTVQGDTSRSDVSDTTEVSGDVGRQDQSDGEGDVVIDPSESVPGGLQSTAPIVGCDDAERPARRLADAEEICEAVGSGRCWYVDPGGDDAGDGTFGAPLATPQEAIRQAAPGDVIYLRGGVYDDTHAHDSRARTWDNPDDGVVRAFASIGRVTLPQWAGGANYDVASGTEQAPITLRSYPGERACAQSAGGIRVGNLREETAWWRIEDITLQGAAVHIGGGARGDGDEAVAQTHHITVRHMEIFDHAAPARQNTGLVKVDRGDWGGPYEIYVESNILHDLSVIEDGATLDWQATTDAQHFGAVATLSCESYVSPDCIGNGRLVVRNNHVYAVPSAFFLKNPALGPFEISDNVVHDVQYLGQWSPSNIVFENNVVFDAGGGGRLGGFGGATTDPVWERSGRNLTMRNNTFVGLSTVLQFRIYASGHTIRNNVVEGLEHHVDAGSWNHMGWLYQSVAWVHPDPAETIEASRIATDNDFDANCFVSPHGDAFLAYGRRREDASGDTVLTHLSLADARTRLGHETASVVTADPAAVFEDFDGGVYRISPDGPCAGSGAAAPTWYP